MRKSNKNNPVCTDTVITYYEAREKNRDWYPILQASSEILEGA